MEGFRDGFMKNQTEKNMGNEMETALYRGLIGLITKFRTWSRLTSEQYRLGFLVKI